MTNIQTVRLENFQSHLDTFVEFTEGLNVIVGQSDSGKTAILRGIRWALYNQPRGTDFIRVGADFVRVTVSFHNGTSIVRERTNSKNRYTIQRESQEDLVLEGFGIHVPDEVLEAHGMGHLRIDHDNELMIHLSQQLDGPFLLEQTNSVRAKTLGRISGAHFLDMAIRDVTKDVSQLNQRLKQEQLAIEKLQEELIPYSSLNEMQQQLDQTDNQIQQIKQLEERKNRLQLLKLQKERLDAEEEETKKRKRLVSDVDVWSTKVEHLQAIRSRYMIFDQKQKQYQEMNKAIVMCQKWLEKTQHAQVATQKLERTAELVTLRAKLKSLLSQQETIQQALKQEEQRMQRSSFVDSIHVTTLEKIAEKQQKYQQLKRMKERINAYIEQRRKVSEFTSRLPQVDETMQRQELITDAYKKVTRLQAIQSQLKEFDQRLKEGKRFIQLQLEEQEKAESEWQKRLLAEGTCPTCGQSICKHENETE